MVATCFAGVTILVGALWMIVTSPTPAPIGAAVQGDFEPGRAPLSTPMEAGSPFAGDGKDAGQKESRGNVANPDEASPKRASLRPLPTTPSEVNRMLSNYFGRFGVAIFFPAVDNLFEEEVRNDDWAASLEKKFTDDADAVRGMTVSAGSCRESLCRFVVDFPGDKHRMTALFEFEQRFVGLSSKPDHMVALYYEAEGSQRCVMYVFSLDPRAAYVEKLHEMFEVSMSGGESRH
jgi:hypothetical protein